MDNQADPQVVLIPRDSSQASTLDSTAKAFRKLRLQGLQTEPASFSSSYSTESQRPPSFWTKRLQDPQARTFALIHTDPGAQCPQDSEPAPDRPWTGMLVLLGPKVIDPNAYDNSSSWREILPESSSKFDDPEQKEAGTEFSSVRSALAYHVVAVYLVPEVRGKGLAKRLMSSAFISIKQDVKNMGYGQAICTVGVAKGVIAARKTYASMGFVDVAEDHYTTDDGRTFHDSVMRRDLTL